MLWLFRSLTDRLKALFVVDVANGFEAQLVIRDAERKAELLRQARRYDDEGLKGIALHLRQQAEQLSTQRPLATVLPSIEHWHSHPIAALPAPAKMDGGERKQRLAIARRKGR